MTKEQIFRHKIKNPKEAIFDCAIDAMQEYLNQYKTELLAKLENDVKDGTLHRITFNYLKIYIK